MQRGEHIRPLLVLIGGCALCAALASGLPRSKPAPRSIPGEPPRISPANALVAEGATIAISATHGDRLWATTTNDIERARGSGPEILMPAVPDRRAGARALATPTAMQWRHPRPGLPSALVVRAAQSEGLRARGPYAMRTYLFERHSLPVLSISMEPDGLLSEDRGIAVPGNGILRLPKALMRSYAIDPKWWKYPGNYHGRGDAWEREARLQLIAPDGEELFQADAALRINGQMTRGFPQHAYRLVFNEPLGHAAFADGDGQGSLALVLRAAGNDQVKAMLRDAFQHQLCQGLPFGTSKSLTCVAYINGAYQGVHHLRQRLDERELARRHGASAKRITIIEDKNALYRGDSADVKRFARLMAATERWDAVDPAWVDTLEARLDVDGFLTYMASQMILGNMDWPRQNVKYWRYTGMPGKAPLDGRWRMVMGDSDLGFGANAPASTDLFTTVNEAHVPLSRLFLAMMRHEGLRSRFVAHGLDLLEGALATDRCLAVLDSMSAAMRPEMAWHTARWRKPADERQWEREVEMMRAFARERPAHARKQLISFQAP
ncbi:MAG: CotH kinase family protein [Flavobacteriales bacterium]|jgi:hypothetical protein|nr:CotH kinase family protein [Flavobacteriales bacterium]